jgi:alpha-D-xyloside xylohydrolase
MNLYKRGLYPAPLFNLPVTYRKPDRQCHTENLKLKPVETIGVVLNFHYFSNYAIPEDTVRNLFTSKLTDMLRKLFFTLILSFSCFFAIAQVPAQPGHPQYIVNEPYDISGDFHDFTNTFYLASELTGFLPEQGTGKIIYNRYEYFTRQAFNNMLGVLRPVPANEFPPVEYAASPSLSFSVEFVSPRSLRIRAASGPDFRTDEESLMLVKGKAPADDSWIYTRTNAGHRYTGEYGSVIITEKPWHICIYDADGKLLTKTIHHADNSDSAYTPVLPFSFVRRASDYSRSFSAVFALSPDEKIFGCGESYTGLNKRGQRVILYADDANGVQNESMYKPVPFFMSSRGYGIFMHTSSPVTCDFGRYFNGVTSLMIGDDELDLFVFIGNPKEILNEYTSITGKAAMPPLWSFGFWMSRITYFSEADGRAVADKLRVNRIPCDVIHFDTGWFEYDWRCDYRFSPSRFKDPQKMIADLKKQGFHISLWQLPYFVPKNTLFPEIIQKGLAVRDAKGNIPYEDAVLDFSNPETVRWYSEKIAGLLRLGVGAIKVDFGEAAPLNGLYYSGKTGFYEHNLYPLRYNKAVADITREINGENIIWARSAWAGSQRYPTHWGGDPANTNTSMAATLRGGLSLGLSGFSFWSHDMGGFVQRAPENLYRRWVPFGMLTSHARSHGIPPKEPWEYGEDFMDAFRQADEMRYCLMPYIYAQAKHSSENGLPMVRALFIEYPDDPGSWLIDNEYLFGSDILVAPMFENTPDRDVYLPPGKWIDYQTGKAWQGGWHRIAHGGIPVIMLVREGSVIPHISLEQTTMEMDWSNLKLVVFASENKQLATGKICLPSDNMLHELSLSGKGGSYEIENDPYQGKISWTIVNSAEIQ